MLVFLKPDIPILQLFFIVIGNGAKIRNKNIIALPLSKVCRTHPAFAGTENNKQPPNPLKGEFLIGYVFVLVHFISIFFLIPPLGGQGVTSTSRLLSSGSPAQCR